VKLEEFHPRWKGRTLVYRLDQGRIRPFFTRREIDTEKLLQDKPIAWTRSLVDVYYLQVQGSGRMKLPDGQVRHVLYAGKNGHEYVSLGKVMLERGLLSKEEMSMQSIRRYLAEHPGQVEELLNTNPSYVFFRLAADGPLGAMGRTLTPMVSMATDSDFLPLGSIVAVDAVLPGTTDGSTALLALAQDRGGAIKGSRLDLFCGAGPQAEFLAGHLQVRPRAFLLLKK
jgi:membrane-bound lytic murein transglycosylase A